MTVQSTKAVIDIGTNTFHLLVADIDSHNNIIVKHKTTLPVKLGEGGVNKGYLTDAAYARGIEALVRFRKELNDLGLQEVYATATAAVRDASNGKQFIDEALAKADIKIHIIDGLQEAEYIFKGAKAANVLGEDKSLIMDIGGGSVEFIICNAHQIFWMQSFRLGAARLLADFHLGDEPLAEETITKIKERFEKELKSLFEATQIYQPEELIGTAGSFDSFAEIVSLRKCEQFDAKVAKRYDFNENEFKELLEEIILSNHHQRENMAGLVPLRVDMIVMASVLTRFILRNANIHQVKTCCYALKEGLLLS